MKALVFSTNSGQKSTGDEKLSFLMFGTLKTFEAQKSSKDIFMCVTAIFIG